MCPGPRSCEMEELRCRRRAVWPQSQLFESWIPIEYTVNCHLARLQLEFPVHWRAAAGPGQSLCSRPSSRRLNSVPCGLLHTLYDAVIPRNTFVHTSPIEWLFNPVFEASLMMGDCFNVHVWMPHFLTVAGSWEFMVLYWVNLCPSACVTLPKNTRSCQKDKSCGNAFQTIKFMEFRHKMLLLFPEKVFFFWQE